MAASAEASLLEVEDLHAGYLGIPAVRRISLTVAAGEVVALLGPNGAGKTTTLSWIAVRSGPRAVGRASRCSGQPISYRRPFPVIPRRGMAHVPEDRSLFHGLSVSGEHQTRPTGAAKGYNYDRHFIDLLPRAQEPLMNRRAGLLSGGEQQMLALGRALASDPS